MLCLLLLPLPLLRQLLTLQPRRRWRQQAVLNCPPLPLLALLLPSLPLPLLPLLLLLLLWVLLLL